MSDKFLGSGQGAINLTNGSATIYSATLGAASLQPSKPVKTNSVRQLVSSNLSISEVNNLQTELNEKDELTFVEDDTHTNPPTGKNKIYFKTDGNFYKKNAFGIESLIGGGGGGGISTTNAPVVDNSVVFYDGTTGNLVKYVNGIKYDAVNNTLEVNDLETADTFSLNGEIQKISNITSATQGTPDITVFSGEIDVKVIKSATHNAELEFDNTDCNLTADGDITILTAAGDIQLNGNSLTLSGPSLTYNGNIIYALGRPFFNLVAGSGAGASLTTGNNNIIFGFNAGANITSGSNNIAMGDSSLNAASTQINNISIGNSSQKFSTGNDNISIGVDSLLLNTGGFENVCIGSQAGYNNTTGTKNTYIGFNSGFSNSISVNNVAVGRSSLQYVSGNYNTAVGSLSQRGLPGSNGYENCSLGYNSLFGITTGYQNCMIGTNTGGSMTTGNRNCYLGVNAGGSSVLTGEKNVAIGWQSEFLGDYSNSCVIGASADCDASNQICLGDINVNQIINTGDGVCDLGSSTHKFKDLYLSGSVVGMPYDVSFACTDEVSTITTTGQKMELRCPRTFQLTKIKSSVNTAGGGLFSFNIRKNGTIIQTVVLASSLISNISNTTTFNEDDIISCDIANAGSSTATGLKIYLIGKLN